MGTLVHGRLLLLPRHVGREGQFEVVSGAGRDPMSTGKQQQEEVEV